MVCVFAIHYSLLGLYTKLIITTFEDITSTGWILNSFNFDLESLSK